VSGVFSAEVMFFGGSHVIVRVGYGKNVVSVAAALTTWRPRTLCCVCLSAD